MIDSETGMVNCSVKRSVGLNHGGLDECSRRVDLERVSRPLVMACDEAYAMPLATTLRSIVEASRTNSLLDVYVLSNGCAENTRRKIFDSLPHGSASIRWIPVDLGLFGEFSTAHYISTMTYARLLIPRVLPDSVSRLLYLDADLLVLDDLAPLWETDLQGAVIGAVLDGLDARMKAGDHRCKEVPRVKEYFNAGVLLVDLDRWRKERISERALEYLAHHPSSPYSDQDALNVACDGNWKQLDGRWNCQANEDNEFARMCSDQLPGIVHFVMARKPWQPSSVSPHAVFYDTFRNRTCFARTHREALWDRVQGVWYRLRRVLGRSALGRAIRSRSTSAEQADVTGPLKVGGVPDPARDHSAHGSHV